MKIDKEDLLIDRKPESVYEYFVVCFSYEGTKKHYFRAIIEAQNALGAWKHGLESAKKDKPERRWFIENIHRL